MLHPGLAGSWAETVTAGEPVSIAGPPGSTAFAHNYDHFVFLVDATGLPAVGRWLDEAPVFTSATICVLAERQDFGTYPLTEHAGVTVEWVPDESPVALLARHRPAGAERTVNDGDRRGSSFVFAALEASQVTQLRAQLGSDPDALVTAYWKRGERDFDED